MADITNQQLLESIKDSTAHQIARTIKEFGKDIRQELAEMEQRLTAKMATKDELNNVEKRLTAQMATKDELAKTEAHLTKRLESLDKGQLSLGEGMLSLEKGMLNMEERIKHLDHRVKGDQAANVQHHLTTRKMIGDLNRELAEMKSGLAQAAGFMA